MSDYIPFDIQKKIIKRVDDVKSLTRFKSVSKEWASFINSPKFITRFGIRHTQPHRLLLRYTQSRNVKYVSFSDDVQQQLDFAPNVPKFIKKFMCYQVIGSSCGLWCFFGCDSSETDMVVIWNPSIRKSVGIVVPRELVRTSVNYTFFGFGVCPSTYDPTIVEIKWGNWKCERKVLVYTLSSNTWKMIPSSNMPHESIELRWEATRVAIGRYIYWAALRYDGPELKLRNLILSFDLIDHKFGEVNLPDSMAVKDRVDISMSQLNGSLVVSAYTNEVNGLVYGVWVMGEEGASMTSFTKLFNIKTHDDSPVCNVLGFTMSGEPINVLGFTMSGEPIMEKKKYSEPSTVEVYKPCSEHINDLGVNGDCGSFFICPYTETLLLIDHSDGCIVYNDGRKMMAMKPWS